MVWMSQAELLSRKQLVARRRNGHAEAWPKADTPTAGYLAKTCLRISTRIRQRLDASTTLDRAGFGNLCYRGGGLACLPSRAHTYRRIHRWLQANLISTRIQQLART